MSQGVINLIIHEVQKVENIHLSETSRWHIERLVMSAVQKETNHLYRDKQYWLKKYLKQEISPKTQ